MNLHGIGPSRAAPLLVEVRDIPRFLDEAHFTSWNGTAPIDASSGGFILVLLVPRSSAVAGQAWRATYM
jgi:hypothetical protein